MMLAHTVLPWSADGRGCLTFLVTRHGLTAARREGQCHVIHQWKCHKTWQIPEVEVYIAAFASVSKWSGDFGRRLEGFSRLLARWVRGSPRQQESLRRQTTLLHPSSSYPPLKLLKTHSSKWLRVLLVLVVVSVVAAVVPAVVVVPVVVAARTRRRSGEF